MTKGEKVVFEYEKQLIRREVPKPKNIETYKPLAQMIDEALEEERKGVLKFYLGEFAEADFSDPHLITALKRVLTETTK
jgi:hypothetical protein